MYLVFAFLFGAVNQAQTAGDYNLWDCCWQLRRQTDDVFLSAVAGKQQHSVEEKENNLFGQGEIQLLYMLVYIFFKYTEFR